MTHRLRTAGITLIETIVALAVIGIALAAIVPAFTNYARVNTNSDLRTGAITAGQQVMESLRQRTFANWPASGEIETVDAGSRDYQVTVNYCLEGAADCLSEGQMRHVRLEVRNGDKVYYELETIYTAIN